MSARRRSPLPPASPATHSAPGSTSARGRAGDAGSLVGAASEGALVVDAEGRILEANEQAESLFGYGPGELAGQRAEALVPERLRGRPVGDWSRTLRRPHATVPAGGNLLGRRRDGTEVPLDLVVDVLAEGERSLTVVGVRANPGHLRAERTSRHVTAVMASSPVAILLVSHEGVIEVWSPGAEALYLYAAEQVVGRSADEALPADTAASVRAVIEQLRRGEPAVGLPAVHERRDGSRVDVSVTGSPICGATGKGEGYCILAVDASRRRRAEHEIAEALDGERQRIGRELHDTLGQQITAIGLLLDTLRSESGATGPGAPTLHHLEELVGQMKSQLRMLIKGVFPVAVDSEGLLWALYDLAHETSELFGISCRVESDSEVAVADNFQATELYWIAREAVHNAVHHGRARDITISLTTGEELTLTVDDDGVGIPAQVDETRSLGLRTMRHRSSIIGGRFSIGPGPGGGTVARCTVATPQAGGSGAARGSASERR